MRSHPILLAVLLAAPATLTGQAITVPATVDTLPNGLTYIVHEDRSAPVVAVNVWYHVGSGSEAPGRRLCFCHIAGQCSVRSTGVACT